MTSELNHILVRVKKEMILNETDDRVSHVQIDNQYTNLVDRSSQILDSGEVKLVIKKPLITNFGMLKHGQIFIAENWLQGGVIYVGLDIEENHIICQNHTGTIFQTKNLPNLIITQLMMPEKINQLKIPSEFTTKFFDLDEMKKHYERHAKSIELDLQNKGKGFLERLFNN